MVRREGVVGATAEGAASTATESEPQHGIPVFLAQLVAALGAAASSTEASDAIAATARLHGRELYERGFTVAQVVRDYGSACKAVTELAGEADALMGAAEFRELIRCLEAALAEAMTEFLRLRDSSLASAELERSGMLAHELGNRASAATLAFSLLERGNGPVSGSLGAVVKRNLRRLTGLIERSLQEVRVDAGHEHNERVAVFDLVEEAAVGAALEAESRQLALRVSPVDRALYVNLDPQLLSGAIANLLLNAMKFTRKGGLVSLKTSASPTRVLIEVEDQCGGLPPLKAGELFEAFSQRGADRSGLGLGLFISRKSVDASGGVLAVRDVPGSGCVFSIDLPRLVAP